MAYDDDLANRIRELTADEPDVIEQRTSGGLAFLAAGNMAVAASGQGALMVRIDPQETNALLAEPHAQSSSSRRRRWPSRRAGQPRGRSITPTTAANPSSASPGRAGSGRVPFRRRLS